MRRFILVSGLILGCAATCSAQTGIGTTVYWTNPAGIQPVGGTGGEYGYNYAELDLSTSSSQSTSGNLEFGLEVIYSGVSEYAPYATGSVSVTFYNYCLVTAAAAYECVSSASSSSYDTSATKSVTGTNPDGIVDGRASGEDSRFTLTNYGSDLTFSLVSGNWQANEGYYTAAMSVSGSASGSPNAANAFAVAYYSNPTTTIQVYPNNGV